MKNNKKKTKREQKAQEIKEAIKRVKSGKWSKYPRKKIKMGGEDWSIRPIKASDAKGIPVITILAEREVKMIELDLDIPDGIAESLVQYGADHIVFDRSTLINWTINKGLRNFINLNKKKKK